MSSYRRLQDVATEIKDKIAEYGGLDSDESGKKQLEEISKLAMKLKKLATSLKQEEP
jgi:hypothetical protein